MIQYEDNDLIELPSEIWTCIWKEAPGKDIDLRIQDQTAGGSQVGFVWISIGDYAVENSNYTNLVNSLELTDKLKEQFFDEFKDANTAYELKEKLIMKPVENQNVFSTSSIID